MTKLKPSVVGPPLTNPSNPELPLNFLKLKNSDPELFEKLLNLESHVEEVKESVMWPEYQKGIVEPLTKMDFDEDLVCQIIGIICTNSFELLQPTKGAPQHGLFETASLMNHDCIGNTRYVQVHLCQKLLFLHQLIHNMTTDCSFFMKIVSSEYVQNMLCSQIIVFVLF